MSLTRKWHKQSPLRKRHSNTDSHNTIKVKQRALQLQSTYMKMMHWWISGLSCKPNIYVSWSTSELRVRLAPLNRFKPSSKIFYWPFQGGTSFVDLLCFCSVLCLLCLCARLFICALWSPAGKGLTSWFSFVVSTVSLSLSHWYPGSGVVLDCIDSWSLHPYLLLYMILASKEVNYSFTV